MIAYIKDRKTFATVAYADVVEYTVPLLSFDDSKGTVVFADRVVEGNEGNWLILVGKPLIIESIKPSATTITVNVSDAITAFNRLHRPPSSYPTTTGQFVYNCFEYNYKTQSDAEYAMPYLNVTNSDSTAIIKPDAEDIFFSMQNYLRKVIQRGIKIDFTVTNTTLDIAISTHGTARNIFANDGNTDVVSEEFSQNTTSKVSVYKAGTPTVYYLQANGSISTTAPSPRIAGQWQMISIGDNDDKLEKAKEVFAANDAAYKIEFYSDTLYEVGQKCKIRIRDKVYDIVISFIEISDKDSRYHYKAGTLATTLSEKLKLILKTR